MKISLVYSGVEYANFTEEELVSAGVPIAVVADAVKKELWKDVTNQRGRLLFETDWTQGKDSPLSAEKITELADYRQKLRDIPQTYSSPDDVVWPEKPSLS